MPVPTTLPSPWTRMRRALALKCPECGAGGIFRHWLRMLPRCTRCSLKLDRGTPDHFVGAYLVNLIIAELLFAGGLGLWLLVVWPTVHWELLQAVAVGAMIVSPLLTYPFTRTVWLAADLVFDPPKATDR